MASDVLCAASTSFKKSNGELALSKGDRLTWTPAGSGQSSLTVEGCQMRALFASKAGSGKIVLRVMVANSGHGATADQQQALNFTFTNASSALSDREHFKTALSDVVAKHREGSGPSSQAPTPQPAAISEKARGKRKAASPTSANQSQDTYDMALRLNLLQREPDLRQLHAEVVLSGTISEDEFWAGREHLLHQASQDQGQQRGRSAQMAEAQQKYGEGGEIKISLTPQLIADIFAQHPVVQRAYAENVPPVRPFLVTFVCMGRQQQLKGGHSFWKQSSGNASSVQSCGIKSERPVARLVILSKTTPSLTDTSASKRKVSHPQLCVIQLC